MRVARLAFALSFVAACSGATSTADPSSPEDDDGGTSTPDGAVGATRPEADGGEFPAPDAAAPLEAGEDAREAGSPDAAPDAEVDAAEDAEAPPDAAPDTGAPDAGQDSAPDAQPDAPPPPVCTNGQTRCQALKFERCQAQTWTWQQGDQRCCTDAARFVVAGDFFTDQQTGLTWYRTVARGTRAGVSTYCSSRGYRTPTRDEVLAIMIGTPQNNISVCSPTADQAAFLGLQTDDVTATGGCVSLTTGAAKDACSSTVTAMCVVP